jgi:serine/threonine-protein kinase HipA
MTREIYVFGDWHELEGPHQMGLLRAEKVHGRETFSFEYTPEWLESTSAMLLDPELKLLPGTQYLNDKERPNFGMFLDSSPDRWGQLLMKRRELRTARTSKRKPRILLGSDFLLGVHDEQRMGALRFKTSLDQEFLSDEQGLTAPPWTRLRELESAAWQFQSVEDGENDDESQNWLRLLMAPGSSIGGARPKAGVCDEDQYLWIAKFPARNDQYDLGGWEMVVHRLAQAAHLNVAEAKIMKLGRPYHTFLVKRFDRVVINNQRRRKHFASAMTMLGYSDGASFQDGASYLEIVDFLMRYGADPDADMHELWRRIVFSICVSNTDDHLRNHGFILQPDGWKLSPAYDINPDPTGAGLSLNISEADNSLSLELAMEVASFFRLDHAQAVSIIEEVKQAVSLWREIATEIGISRAEQNIMKNAFDA